MVTETMTILQVNEKDSRDREQGNTSDSSFVDGVLDVLPCRTFVTPVDRMPVVMHLPCIDERIDLDHCNAREATCTESECCDARDLHVAADDDLLFFRTILACRGLTECQAC